MSTHALVHIKRAYADLSHGQLHYRVAGNRNKPVLLLLHQSPSSSVMYEQLMSLLGNEFYLLAPDTPGFGMSDPLTGSASVEAYAKIIREFLLQQGVDSTWVFGHHTGASVAVQLAFDAPGLVTKLALSGPTLLSEALKSALPEKAKAFPAQADGSHLLAMWQRMRAKEPDAPLDLTLRETLLGLSVGEAYPEAYDAVIDQAFEAQLRSLDLPVLVFAGDGDPLYPQLDAALSACQQGKKAVLSGARTYACDLFAADIARLLCDFFQSETSGDSE